VLSAPRIVAVEHAEQRRATRLLRAPGHNLRRRAIERLIERVGGLDVHKQTVAACARVPGSKGTREQYVRTFGGGRRRSCACAIGSESHGVTHVAVESTGVYWKSIPYVPEESFACLLVKPAHVKEVPGRKDRRRRLGGAGLR
jgi:hypothetical protein